MHSSLAVTVLSLIFFPLFGSIHCISNGSPAQRRGIFATSESYPTPPPPPIPKIHYGPKPPNQLYVSKLAPDEHLVLPPPPIHHFHHPPPPHHHHHRGPPTHIHTHVHNSPLPSHGILPPSLPPHSIQLKASPSRGGHGPPIPTFHIPGLPQIRIQNSISHGPTISHGPFGPPPLSPAPVSPQFHFNQHHGPPRDLILHNRPMYHPPPSPPPAPTPPTPPPPPPAPPKPFATWKPPPPPPTFRAPAVKESFHASPSAIYQSTNHFHREDEDKGPIHTIPAPNLSLSDKPASGSGYRKQASQHSQLPHITKPVHSDHTPVDVYSIKGYQVIEDSTAHKPGQPSYFAPDPDPSIQSPRVPQTHDPFSMPSNGQQPLDLIIQQHNDKKNHQFQQLQQLTTSLENGENPNGNTLTAQDLFNIFSTINQQQLHVIPPASDTDTDAIHGHQNQDDIYNSIQQHLSQPQDFHPQFQTFNYEEQTQQGAQGSDSFPLGASNVEYKRAAGMQQSAQKQFNNMQKAAMQGFSRNSITQQQRQQYNNALTKLSNNFKLQKINSATKNRVSNVEKDVINNHVDNSDEDQNGEDEEEEQTSPDTLSTEDVTLNSLKPLMYTTLPNKKAADTLANLAAAGYSKSTSTTVSMSTSLQTSDNQDSNNGDNSEEGDEEEESGEEEDYSDKQDNARGKQGHNDNVTGRNMNYNNNNNNNNNVNNNNGNVQLQKAIQIYETSYFDQDIRNRGSSSNRNSNQGGTAKNNDNDGNYSSNDTSDMEESESESRYESGSQSNQNSGLSYGARIRPKRN